MKLAGLFLATVLLCSIFVSCFMITPVKSASGLVGWWKFDDGSGTTATDSSGNGNLGTLHNGPTWVDGIRGKALSFDGVDDFVYVSDSSSLHIYSAVTVEAWVYLPSGEFDYSGHPKILSKNAVNNAGNLELAIYDNAGHVDFIVGSGTDDNNYILVSTGTVPRNSWTHVAATYDGSLMKIYLNGVLDSSYPFTGSINTDNGRPLTIGKNNFYPWSYEYWMKGTIDDVKLYNRAMSQQEVQADMIMKGPSMDNLFIKYYSNPSDCAAALQNGTADLTDLASSSAQMDVVSPGNSLFEFDFNNNATLPSYSNFSYSHLNNPTYYKGFRQGVACLANKDYIVNHIVNYSRRVDTPILPWGNWWIDWSVCQYDSYGNLLGNYPYEFNSNLANQYFNQAGFIQGTTPNPYYDPSFPGSALYLRVHPQTHMDMPSVIFYIRNDDPYRLEIGRMLRDNLRKMGVPVYAIEANGATCRQHVVNLKDYNIYTGGWGNLDAFSLLYNYGTNPENYEWPYSYVQFKNATYDQYVEKVWHATSLSDAKNAALECQKILVQECAGVWLYSLNSIMGYNNLCGIVNFRGGRIDNKWTLLTARPSEGNSTIASQTIHYGLRNPPSSLNVITDYAGAFPLDSYNGLMPVDDCLNQIYDTLLSYSPVDKTPGNAYGQGDRGGTMPWMATDWQIGNWSSPYEPGKNLTELTFYLRDNIKWQDGVELNSTDVKFTIEYLKALGDVASLSSNVADVYSVITPDAHTVSVYENVSNIWTLDLIGTIPILPKHIFQNIANVSGYTPGASQGIPASEALIGSGPWKYVSNNASMLILQANRDYFMETSPPTEVDFRYNWEMGSWVVDAMDEAMVGEAFNSTGSFGPSAKWEPRADVNGNGVIDSTDVGYVASEAMCFNVTWGSSGQYVTPQPSTNCTMYVDTSNSQILKGENFTAYVKATNVNKLSGYQFELHYDESSLNCLNITLSPPFSLPCVKIWNGTTGLIMSGATLLGSTPPVSNLTLTLATIKFNAKNGGGSTLHLLDTELAQYGAPLLACQPIPHKTIDKGVIIGVPTPTGTNVAVSPSSYAQVNFTRTTTAGVTTLNVTQPPSTVLAPVGNSVFCDIKTTATYAGNVTLQFAYNPTGLTLEDEKAMKIWLWNATSNKYVDITKSVDTDKNIVYGVSPHLSMFAITCTVSFTDNNNQQVQTTVQTPTSAPALPDGREALAYYTIQATQQYTPPVNIRLVYDPSTISPEEAPFLQMWLWNETSNKWVDRTTKVDTVNNIVYGVSPHLSMFAITCLQPFPQGIATLSATCSKTIVGEGYSVNINALIQNQGGLPQSFKVFVYANSTIIYTQQISNLPTLGQTSVAFTFDTTGLTMGNYSINACDKLISWIKVTIPGDMNGDGKVGTADLHILGVNWGLTVPPGDPRADINGDGSVGTNDLHILGVNWGATW